jgi:hypothetical protein
MGSCELFAWAGLESILLISASQVVRITGVSHWHPALRFKFNWETVLFGNMSCTILHIFSTDEEEGGKTGTR